jgi:SAM-dependent methyltransferase
VKTEAELWPLIAEMEMREAGWEDPPEFNDADHHPCLFYPPKWFALELDAAVTALRESGSERLPFSFLEVGCGIGTKAVYASRAYSLTTVGIDRIGEYVAEAKKAGLSAFETDALHFGSYGDYGIVYVNHPFKDFDAERVLEHKIQADMMAGAVLICVNTMHYPRGWEVVCKPQMWPHHGVWRKPV